MVGFGQKTPFIDLLTFQFVGALREALRPAVPSLVGLLKDKESFVRNIAASTLNKLALHGKRCQVALSWLNQMLRGYA